METFERIVKIISAIAVPVIIGVFGWMIQANISDKNLERDYVQIAVGILSSDNSDPGLRDWAVDMLNTYAEIKFDQKIEQDLKRGTIALPESAAREIRARVN